MREANTEITQLGALLGGAPMLEKKDTCKLAASPITTHQFLFAMFTENVCHRHRCWHRLRPVTIALLPCQLWYNHSQPSHPRGVCSNPTVCRQARTNLSSVGNPEPIQYCITLLIVCQAVVDFLFVPYHMLWYQGYFRLFIDI